MTQYDRYIEDVMSGKIITGELAKLTVQRHLDDLERSKSDDFPYYFNTDYANRVIRFIKMLRHTQGTYAGKLFGLQDNQAFDFAMIYGWLEKGTDFRRFMKFYKEVARKNGKSEEMAAHVVYGLIADNENAPRIYSVATKKDQAMYIYSSAQRMMKFLMKDSPTVKRSAKPGFRELRYIATDGIMKALAADAGSEDGANPSMWLVDEYHAHSDDTMVKIGETAMGSRDQALLGIITTAGFNKFGPCYAFRGLCINILRGIVTNDRIYAMIHAMDDGNDWHDERNWYKANPNMGVTPKIDKMRSMYQNAITEGAHAEIEFRTKNLNQWTDSASTWIQDKIYMERAKHRELESLRGQKCFVGVDLAAIHDLVAITWHFRGLETPYYMTDYIGPHTKISAIRADGVDYKGWHRDGWIQICPGDTIDSEFVVEFILKRAEMFEIKLLGYDPYKAVDLISGLSDKGIEMGKVRQGVQTMAPACEMFYNEIIQKKVEHDGNPVTRWMMANITPYFDKNNNVMFDKGKSANKIDGPVSIANSYAVVINEMLNAEPEQPVKDVDYYKQKFGK